MKPLSVILIEICLLSVILLALLVLWIRPYDVVSRDPTSIAAAAVILCSSMLLLETTVLFSTSVS